MEDDIGIYWGDTLLKCNESYEPIIDKFLYRGEVMCLAAKPKTGKSVFIQQVMFSLSTGKPFLNKYKVAKPCNVLYVQAEGTRQETISRFHMMSRAIQFDKDRIFHVNRRDISLATKDGLRRLLAIAEIPKVNYDVIILDPLYKLMAGGDINSATDVTNWTNNADILFRHWNASGIVIHHDSEKEFTDMKGNKHGQAIDTLFGSTFWSGFFSSSYKLYRHKGKHYLKLGVQRSGFNEELFKLRYIVPQKDKNKRLLFELDDLPSVKAGMSLGEIVEVNIGQQLGGL